MNAGTTLTRLRADLGSAGTALQRLLLAGLGSTVLVLVVAVGSYLMLARARTAQRSLERSLDVIMVAGGVQRALLDAAMGRRAFLAEGGAASLARERAAAGRALAGLDRLREIVAGDRVQEARVNAASLGVHVALAELDAQRDEAVRMGVVDDAVRRLEALIDEAGQSRRVREAEHAEGLAFTAAVVGGGGLVAFVLGLAVNLGICKGVIARQRTQMLVEAQAVRLQAQTNALARSEHALAEKLEDHRALAERLQIANTALDEHVRELGAAKADAERALVERSRMIAALSAANDDLEQLAYAASHDLKAPLRGIANLAEWLEDDLGDAITPAAREHLRLLRGRVQRLDALVAGILAYARAGRAPDDSARIDVGALLRDVVTTLSPPPGVVTVEDIESMPHIHASRAALEEVWMCLVGNALKHAGGRGVVIRVAARDAGDVWEFSVSDNGPGIEPAFHERIFRMFQTLSSRDRVEGTGLGLAIVKKIVESRGGRVWVESDLGRGATFTFTWRKA
ncbi:two-component sensor histidine kinase [Minicystis rosea]|nr:two-component sensor histidine kinase [Minicystis rosea]